MGRIINISSVHDLVASPYKAAYVAAKHGLEGLSKVTAFELATNGIITTVLLFRKGIWGTAQDVLRRLGRSPTQTGATQGSAARTTVLGRSPTPTTNTCQSPRTVDGLF